MQFRFHHTILPVPAFLALLLALAVSGCAGREAPVEGAARDPAGEVRLLASLLRQNDLDGFVAAAVPPELQPALGTAWAEGRSRWPLTELPFDERLPELLATLSAEGADQRLRRDFDRQFRNARGELRSAARTLGLFGSKYIERDPALSEAERAHYTQLIKALSAWGQEARLDDPQRARAGIARLTGAARRVEVTSEETLSQLGMTESLRQLEPFLESFKDVLRQYDLDLDASLDEMQAESVMQEDDRARVRLQYPFAGAQIVADLEMRRVGGRWYVAHYLTHAEDAAAVAPAPVLPGPGSAPQAPPGTPAVTDPASLPVPVPGDAQAPASS